MPSEPPAAALRGEGEAQGLPDARGGRLRLGLHGPAARRCRSSSRRCWRRRPTRAVSDRQDRSSTATGRRSSKARSIPRTSPRCIRPTWCRRRSTGAEATRQHWLRPSTDKAPRLQVQRTDFGFRYAAHPPADPERRDARLRAHHAVRRAVHRADPAEQPVQRGDPSTCRWTTRTRRSTSSPGASDDDAGRPRRGASSSAREVGVDVDRAVPQDAHARQRFPAGPRGDEGRQLHRHPRHPEPGHRDVGDDGPDRRPHAGAARRERHRDRAVPPHHGRGGTRLPGHRPRDRPRRRRTSRRRSCAHSKAWCRRPRTGAPLASPPKSWRWRRSARLRNEQARALHRGRRL